MPPRPFVAPMLAGAVHKNFLGSAEALDVLEDGFWFAEEKYDGQRVCAAVLPNVEKLLDTPEGEASVRLWSRHGLPHVLPAPLRAALARLPIGIYDGELLPPGRRAFGAVSAPPTDDVTLVLFDVVELLGRPLMYAPKSTGIGATYTERRAFLTEIWKARGARLAPSLELAWSRRVDTVAEVTAAVSEVFDRGGEGVVIKRSASLYESGKRVRSWLKIKRVVMSELVVESFEPGPDGPCTRLTLRDADGRVAVVEPRNKRERARLEVNPAAAIGRALVIEHRGVTPDGRYLHPTWDRWADE